jgi:hypothetical protein
MRLLLAAACTVVMGVPANAQPADAVIGGPSVLLAYEDGASPYSGAGRYEGRAVCTAFFLETGPFEHADADAPAYAVTAGRCVAPPEAPVARIVFNIFHDSRRRQLSVPVARTVYAAPRGDIALLELAASYRELTGQLIRPGRVAASSRSLAGALLEIVGAPSWMETGQSWLRLTRCRGEGVAPVVIEHTWSWLDLPFNHCRDVLPWSWGSPVISTLDRRVVGIVAAMAPGYGGLTECALGHPCEPVRGGARTRRRAIYVMPVAGVTACFDRARRFDAGRPGCPLERHEPPVAPTYIGPVNPLLKTHPLGPVRRTWSVAVAGVRPYYQYAVVSPPIEDCRTTRRYTGAIGAAAVPVIDPPLPTAEGFVFLCVLASTTQEEDAASRPVRRPAIVVARTDLTPPRVPAQLAIEDAGGAWRLHFTTFGDEVAFHNYKLGPASDTRCEDPAGYRLTGPSVIGLPRAAGPQRVCAIPYDAAGNPGRLLDRVLS